MKIDTWNDEYSYLKVDSDIKHYQSYSNDLGTKICGNNVGDYPNTINVNFTHNSTTMSI